MHQHNHSHHDHHHGSSGRIGMAFFLNFIFTIVEFIGGWLTNSTAIMADAVHDLGDTLALGSAWVLDRLSKKGASSTFSYGYRRLSLLGALINSIVLIIGSIWILIEAIPRLLDPVMPDTEGMLILAVFGVAVNGFAAYKLSKGTTHNEKVLNWHLLEDVLGWVGVLIIAIIMQFVHWPILDPILSIGFTLFILLNVCRNLSSTLHLFLQGIPDTELLESIRSKLLAVKGADSIHHLHLWSLDGEQHVLTAHIKTNTLKDTNEYLDLKSNIHDCLSDYELAHTTIEIEFDDEVCRDE